MKKDLVEVKKVKECVKKCKFLVSMLQKIFERSPLQSAVVRSSPIFDPKVMVSYFASDIKSKRTVTPINESKFFATHIL